jgi:hypothetical protein
MEFRAFLPRARTQCWRIVPHGSSIVIFLTWLFARLAHTVTSSTGSRIGCRGIPRCRIGVPLFQLCLHICLPRILTLADRTLPKEAGYLTTQLARVLCTGNRRRDYVSIR